MEERISYADFLASNTLSAQKDKKSKRRIMSYAEYQTYRDLSDGRLNRDLEELNKSLNELDAGWKDAKSIEETKKRLSGIVTRLSSAKQYVTDYGEGEDSVKSVADAYQAYADILNGFGDIQSYYSQFANAEDYDKRVGRRKTLYENATSAEDFEKYAGVGAAIKNPSMREAEGDFLLFGQRIGSKDIGNIVTYSIDNNKDLRFGATNGAKLLGDLRYSNLKDDEVAVYNYWLAKENAGLAEKGTAQSYLESMDDILNQREAGELADALDGNLGLELVFGFSAGLSQFGNGVKNALSFGDDYIAPTMEAYASQKVRDNLADTGGKFLGSSLGQIGYDTASTIGNMFPTILLSAVMGGQTAGAIAGVSAMGLSAAGNSYQELLNSGMNKGQARALSTVLGVWEGASEYFLGRIEGLSGDFVGKALGKTKLVKGLQSSANGLTRALLRFFDQFVIDPAQEGLEEVIQDIGSTAINAIFTGEWDFSSAEELAYSFTLGALSAAVMNAPTNLVSNTVNDLGTYRQGKNIMDVGGVDALKNLAVETAKESGENSTLGKYAENVAKKPTPTNVGILDQKINEEKNENNRKSIEQALIDQMTEDGVSAKKAKRAAAKLSEILLEDYNGGEVDLKKAMKNPSVKKVYDKVVKGEGSELAKRDAHHTEVREGIIRDYVDGKIEKSEMDKSLSEKFSFTDDGETINTKTGEKITLAARDTVVSNEDGNLTLKLENGETVRASDISFSSKGEAVLYSVIADMGVGADTANTLISSALGTDGRSMISVAFGIRDAYWYGAKGVNEAELASGVFTSKLTEAVRKTAYNLGKTEAIYAASKKTAPTSVKGDTVYEGEHRIVDGKISDAKFGRLNDRQKSGLALAKTLSKLGANVYVYETTLTERQSGKENGYYISDDGSIHIDLNSGSVKGEGLVAYTVTHEFVHFIEDFSPEKFKKYADLLFEELGMDQKSVSSMLTEETLRLREQEKYKNLGESKLRDIAYSEVVAKCSEKIFTDTDALSRVADRLAKTDRTLLQKIVDFFKIIISRLRGDYEGQSANSLIGDLAADTLTRVEAIRDIFADAAVDALQNFRKAERKSTAAEKTLSENGISVDKETDSASLSSVRDVLDEKSREKVAVALSQRFGVTKAEALQWLSAETSLASLILNPKYSQYLDYIADPNEVAIKTNSDYPQGTVDFSPICAKRREFTAVMNHVLRLFPDHVFDPADLAKIRTIMQAEGMSVPCGICYVEDRRQLDTIVAQNFIDSLKLYREGSKTRPDGKPFNPLQQKSLGLVKKESYTPSVYELVSLEGLNILKQKNPTMASAWMQFNNARGMQAVRLLANEAEYKRQILKYSPKTVKSKNDRGGLRIYSFSDAEMFHLIDIIQVITDSAVVGLSIQGYTKVNEYAKAVKDTGMKLNRSLIPKGELGYHIENGRKVLDFDTVEGIDIHGKDFFDSKDNPNIGNITIGVNDEQIRAAMASDFIDQIIPFHTGQSEDVLKEKGIASWENYKDFQTEKDIKTGKASAHQVNIYTEVLQVLEAEGVEITKRSFVEKFLQVCKENGLTPRFSRFLNTDENGNFIYTEGYHKLLVDFKTFAQTEVGEYLPQMPVKPIFDNDYITSLLKDYATSQEAKNATLKGSMPKVVNRIAEEIVKPNRKASPRNSKGESLSREQQAFFKDSKIRDEDGNLLVVYHGTSEKFTVFDRTKSRANMDIQGSFFSPWEIDAGGYGENVGAYYLNIKNPASESEAYRALKKFQGQNNAGVKAREYLESLGYDGVNNGGEEYIAFDSNQIKRVDNLKPTADPDVRYSLREGVEKDVEKVLNDFDYRDDVYLTEGSPSIITSQKGTRNLPMLMKASHIRENIFTEAEANQRGLRVDKHTHYHGLGKDLFLKVIGGLDNVTLAYRGTKNANDSTRRENYFLLISQYKDAKGNTINVPVYINELGQYNRVFIDTNKVATVFGKDNFLEYIQREVQKGNLVRIKKRSTQTSERAALIADGYSKNASKSSNGQVLNMKSKDSPQPTPKTPHDGNATVSIVSENSENVNRESEKSFSEKQSDRYTYDSLVSKPDMKITVLEDTVPKNRADVISAAKKNAAKIGKFNTKDGSVSVYVDDIGTDVVLSTQGLKHGLDRRFADNAKVTLAAGEILKNAIRINELVPSKAEAASSYVLIGTATAKNGEMYAVRFVVNRFSNELTSMDVLYAINAKKENPLRSMRPGIQPPVTDSTISIAQLLEYVNRYFPDVLPEDVLKHYGYDARPEGEIGKSALYSEREDLSNRTLLANALGTVAKNEAERQKLNEYKTKIGLMEQAEGLLSRYKKQIKELSFAKGKRDTEKIRSLQDNVRKVEAVITKYDGQLFRLEASEALRNVLSREVAKAKRIEAKKYVESLNEYRQKTAETVNEIVRKNRESRKNAIEGRNRTAARNEVKKIVAELNAYLAENKVLIGMQRVVAEALDAINMDTVGADARVAKYDELIAKTTDPEIREELTKTRNRIAAQGESMQGKLQKLKAAYADIINSSDPLIANSHDEVIEGKLDDVIREVGDTAIRDMTMAQLEAVYDLYKMILTSVRQANKAFRLDKAKTIEGYASEVMTQAEKTHGTRGKVPKLWEYITKNFGWDNLKPIYAMRMIGSDTLTELYKNVREGQSVWYKDFAAARDFLREQKKAYGVSKWDYAKKYTFTAESGKTFDMTLEQILSLYAYSKRPQAIDHLTKGGIVFDDAIEVVEKNRLGIPMKYTVNDKSAYRLSEATITEILNTLTEEQKAYADIMQAYLSEVMGEKGNEISLAMYGVKLFKEKNYFPLKSSGQFLYTENEVKGEAKIKNAGFTKSTVPRANNPIIMSNFTDVWVGHCNEMSMYHAFTLPLEDFNRVWQYKARGEGEDVSVRTTLANTCGDAANTYIKDLLVELNGGVRVKDAGVLDKLTGLAKKGAVFMSASVTIQQPSAICRAMAYISPKYFLKTATKQLNFKKHAETWEECKKYAPIAGIKEMGYFDTGMGRSSLEWAKSEEYEGFRNKLKAFFKDGSYRDELLSKAPAFADEITWCHIWNATKAWVADTTSLVGEELLTEAGKRFTDVIDLTQVYDSVLSRSANMRNKNSLMKMATAFMAEPTTTANMMLDAFVNGKRAGGAKGAGIVAKAGGAVLASIVLNSLLKAVVYAWRDDDDEKSYGEKYLESALGSFLDDIIPFNYIPVLRDIVSLFQGYDVSRLDMSLFEDLIRALQSIDSSRKSAYRKVADIIGALAKFFGLPIKNIERDLRPLIQKIIKAFR